LEIILGICAVTRFGREFGGPVVFEAWVMGAVVSSESHCGA